MGDKRGRPRRDTQTTTAERFRWLILQLKQEGLSEPEISRRTGIGTAYLNAIVNHETSRRNSIGAEIPLMVKKGLGVDVNYFYDEYTGKRPYNVYLIDAQREKARLAEIDKKIVSLDERVMSAESKAAEAAHAASVLMGVAEKLNAIIEGLAPQAALPNPEPRALPRNTRPARGPKQRKRHGS